ncbi:signal peptidase I [Candidatus Berkelbacteria bacterium]|nr:signal peptidase I [Candidatus Berkelbacteria bacterium]
MLQSLSLVLLIGVGAIALSGRTNLLGDYHFYAVLTGSMEPAIPTNSLIFVRKPNSSAQIVPGDIITFKSPDASEQLITHRVASFEQGSFRTQGDANPSQDPWRLNFNDIQGQYQFHLPYLGAVLTFLRTPLGIGLLVGIPVLILVFHDLFSINTALFEMKLERERKKAS